MSNFIFHIRKVSLIVLAFLLWIMASMPHTLAQCAMCKGQLESHGDNGTSLAVNMGVIYLLMMPFLFVGIVGYVFYRKSKQKDEDKGEDKDEDELEKK